MDNQNISLKDLYFSFNGRISLASYWLHGVLILPGLFFLVGILYLGLWDFLPPDLNESLVLLKFIISSPIIVVFGVASLALIVKRCHDRNHSGWFILIQLIPIIGQVWYLAEICFTQGTKGENHYGKGPLKLNEKILTRGLLKRLELEPIELPRKENLFRIFNIIGLILSISIVTLCITYIQKELSYDRFHEKYDRIHRVGVNVQLNEYLNIVQTPYPMAEALVAEFPEIEKATRITRGVGKVSAMPENKQFNEEHIYFTDSEFTEIFSLQFIKGDVKTSLKDSNSVVITKEMAVKYFSDQDPLGKSLVFDDTFEYQITGVVEKWPQNSHFQFDFLAFLNPGLNQVENWGNFSYYTYILLKDNYSPSQLEIGLSEFTKKYLSTYLQSGGSFSFYLQPLADIHLHSQTTTELNTNGNLTNVKIATVAALLLLIFACFNFVSLLSTHIIENNSKSLDHNILISNRKKQFKKLITEAFLESLIGLLVAIGLTWILLQFTPSFLLNGLESSLSQTIILSSLIWAISIVLIYCAGFLFLVTFKYHVGTLIIKGGLTVLQTSIVLLLLICTFQVSKQLQFMKKKDLGFDMKDLMAIDLHDHAIYSDSIKAALLDNPDILYATAISSPVPPSYSSRFSIEGMEYDDSFMMQTIGGGIDILNILGIELLKGEDFSERILADRGSVTIINQTAARRIGVDPIVGKQLVMYTDQPYVYQIIGVMKDVHFNSLHGAIEPLAILIDKSERNNILLVKLNHDKNLSTITFIEETSRQFGINLPLRYTYLEDRYKNMYDVEERIARLLFFASFVTIFICCFSIYSLLAYLIYYRQRQKIPSPFLLHLILIPGLVYWASVISWPVAYILLVEWLDNFSYRVKLTEIPFIIAVLLFIGIFILITLFTYIRHLLLKGDEA